MGPISPGLTASSVVTAENMKNRKKCTENIQIM